MMEGLKEIVNWFVSMVTSVVIAASRKGSEIGNGVMSLYPQVKALVFGQLIIIAVAMILMALGFLFQWQFLVVFASLVAGTGFFIFWKLPDLALHLISQMLGSVPWIGSPINTACNELKRMLSPLLTVGMIFSFIGVMVAIRGIGYYSLDDIMVTSAIGTFIFMFMYYIDSQSRWTGYVMMGSIVFTLIAYRIAPIQVLAIMDSIGGLSIKTAVQQGQDSQANVLVTVGAGTPCFHYESGEFKQGKAIREETVVKIITRKDDPKSRESLYLVVLPVSKGVYIGGQEVYIASRSLPLIVPNKAEVQKVDTTTPLPANVGNTNSMGEVKSNEQIVNSKSDYQQLDYGIYKFKLNAGESTPLLMMPSGKYYAYINPKADINQLFSDGEEMSASATRVTTLPFRLVNKSSRVKIVELRITSA